MAGRPLLYPINQLERWSEPLFLQKFPQLSRAFKHVLIFIIPWLIAGLLLLLVPYLFMLMGVGVFVPQMSLVGGGLEGLLHSIQIFCVFGLILLSMGALPGLIRKKRYGWNLLYYANLLAIILNLLVINIFGLFLTVLISLYILFQIKSFYQ